MSTLHYLTLTDPGNPARPRHLAYYQWGDVENPDIIVCVHGLSRNARDFDFLAEALASRYRVIAMDMAGRGKSDWLTNKTDYNYLTYIADCCALLDGLKLEKVTWLGTSMGGIIGMMLAAQQPQRIKRMVLNDIGAVVSAQGLTRILGYVGSSVPFANAEEALSHLKSILRPFGIASEAEWQFMFEISFNRLPDGRYAFAYDPDISQPFRDAASKADAIADIDLSAAWSQVQCPVLVLRGKESDILTHETAAAMLNRPIPTTLKEFDGVGHAPALLNDVQIHTIIDWLDITHD